MMAHQDKVSILITFAVGLVAGSYLYLAGFATTFKLPEVTTDNIYAEFVVTGESYGTCEYEDSCLSFQLLESGDYRTLIDNPLDGETIIREGSIPASLRRELERNLTAPVLAQNSLNNSVSGCRYPNGTNYSFRVTLDEENYLLDSCLSAIDYEGQAWLTLAKLWNHFANLRI